jgi:hypothetical protein
MSIASPFESETISRFASRPLREFLERPVQLIGFWTAVVIPFVLLGLLATGIAQQSPLLLGGLVATNLLGLVVGKDYKR